jgi:type VI secretion system ImpM family protein
MLEKSSSNNRNNISTGFFGKLSGFTDFIKYNAAGGEIVSIDKWLQESLALVKLKYNNEWKFYYDNTPKMNFVYPFTGTESIILGVIIPSNDKSGRKFPFIIFANINKSVINDLSFYTIPLAYKEIYYSFNEIVETNKSTEDVSKLRSLTNEVKLSEINYLKFYDEYQKFILETKLGSILNSENGNFINLKNIFDERLRIFEHFICFSFVADSNYPQNLYIIGFYIQLLQNVFKNSNSKPGIFWTQGESKSGLLFLSFIKPTPKDFIDILFYDRILLDSAKENIDDNKKNFHSGNSIIRDNSIISADISLNEFLDSIGNYLN